MPLTSQEYANLADHSYGRNQNGSNVDLKSLIGEKVTIEGVKYQVLEHVDSKSSGYQGTIYQRVDTREIVVAHRGTEFGREAFKDGVLADGGMVFGRVNSQARDAIELTGQALEIARKDGVKWGGKAPEVTQTGHSLGGTLAQISAHHYDLRGETFNAYGAASLNYQVPAGSKYRMVNHVMAADAVSSASDHFGQVRIYASQGEITQLGRAGYNNVPVVGGLVPSSSLAASVNTSHMMHNFLNADGNGKKDVSILAQPDARTRANNNALMIDRYRDDVHDLRGGASIVGDGVKVMRDGPYMVGINMAAQVVERLKPDLPPGEPARREQALLSQRGASLDMDGLTPVQDMRDIGHPANGKYQQAFAGVQDVDRSIPRASDGNSERLAAALTAGSPNLPNIAKVSLSEDGRYAFAFGDDRGSGVPGIARVETAAAMQASVPESTQAWAQANQAQQQEQQTQQQRAQQQAMSQQGPVMA